MPVRIQKRGTVTIPAELRHKLGWGPGTALNAIEHEGAVLFYEVKVEQHETPVDPRWRKEARGEGKDDER